MNRLIMLIGLPAAGKSFYCKELQKLYKEDEIEIVSSDSIRKELFGSENEQRYNNEVFEEVYKRVKKSLLQKEITVLDATNLSRKRRINFIRELPKCNCNAVVFAVPFYLCCERNSKRERVVPQYVMERMYKSFEPPHRAEGFSAISYIGVDYKKRAKLSDLMRENIECPHDNPNHSLSCGEHCLKAKLEMEKLIMLDKNIDNEDSFWLSTAAKYHDISKFKCKVFYNYKHEPSEIAHYYCHENVSAYDWLCSCVGIYYWENLELVSNLIANHMIFFCDEGAINKRRKLYGEKFWRYLELLHKADVAAH